MLLVDDIHENINKKLYIKKLNNIIYILADKYFLDETTLTKFFSDFLSEEQRFILFDDSVFYKYPIKRICIALDLINDLFLEIKHIHNDMLNVRFYRQYIDDDHFEEKDKQIYIISGVNYNNIFEYIDDILKEFISYF